MSGPLGEPFIGVAMTLVLIVLICLSTAPLSAEVREVAFRIGQVEFLEPSKEPNPSASATPSLDDTAGSYKSSSPTAGTKPRKTRRKAGPKKTPTAVK